jgi:hypothetical protein
MKSLSAGRMARGGFSAPSVPPLFYRESCGHPSETAVFLRKSERTTKMQTKEKTVALYCRTALADDDAMERQEERLLAYADEIIGADSVFYRDNGANGLTLNRPAAKDLIADMQAGKIDLVVVTNESRITRNFSLMAEWQILLRRYGVKCVALDPAPHDMGETRTAAREPSLAGHGFGGATRRTMPHGGYGRRRRAFPEEHRSVLRPQMLLSETPYPRPGATGRAAASGLAAIANTTRAEASVNGPVCE